MEQRAGDQAQIEELTRQRDSVEQLAMERAERLAKALGLEQPQHYELMAQAVERLRSTEGKCAAVGRNDRRCTRDPGHDGDHSDGVDWWFTVEAPA
jgi:hypothetical protein